MGDEPGREDLTNLVRAVDRVASLLEHRLAPALERIAAAIEDRPTLPAGVRANSARSRALGDLRLELDAATLEAAGPLIEQFAASYPDAPELEELRAEVAGRRDERILALQKRVEVGLEAGEPVEVLAARDELASHLDADGLTDLDAAVLGWLVGLIQSRMRSGTVALDVAQWAGEVVSRYGSSREGQALRESLPVLRRCAGLCGRCGEPYRGIEAACPRCVHAASAMTTAGIASPTGSDPDADPGSDPAEEADADLDHEGGNNGFLDSDRYFSPD